MNRASDRIGWHGSWKASSQCADATQIAEMMVEDFGAVPTVDGTPGLIGIMSQHDVLASFENNRTCRSADVGKRRGEGHMVRISIRRTGCRFRNARHVFLVSNLIHGPVLVAEQTLVGIVARRNVMPASPNYGVEA